MWSELSTASPESTWAASGYTPNVVMARLLAGILTDQSRTAPGARVPGSRARALATGRSTLGRFPAAYWLTSARLVSRKLDDQIWTVRPDTVRRVVLLTVPCTVTARPGRAICGFTDVIPTVTCCAGAAAAVEITVCAVTPVGVREMAAAVPPPASAGPAAASAANAQASTPRRASRGHAGLAGLRSRCVGH